MARHEQQVFDELALLCSSPGYAHAIAHFSFRDSVVAYTGELTGEDLLPLFSSDRLVRTEIVTLVGLLIKTAPHYRLPEAKVLGEYIDRTDALLREIHSCMMAPFDLKTKGLERASGAFSTGEAFREPIFYGGESAYIFQYRDLAVKKYAADEPWLKANKGFDIGTGREIARTIAKVADGKLTAFLSEMRTSTGYRSCLPAFTFTAEEIAAASGLEIGTIEAVLAAFSVPTGETNEGFRALTDFNIVNASPLLRMGDGQYVLFQIYSIAEALYDTPFYWMSADRHYLPTASRNRGTFTEQFCLESLRRVFGDKAVFSNVTLFQRKGTSLGEVDVLVVFGDRAIVVQAKSKKLTLAARKGNDLQIKGDFKKSVQDAYEQAFSCATVLTQAETRLHAEGIGELGLPLPLKKIYFLRCVRSLSGAQLSGAAIP